MDLAFNTSDTIHRKCHKVLASKNLYFVDYENLNKTIINFCRPTTLLQLAVVVQKSITVFFFFSILLSLCNLYFLISLIRKHKWH